jgi:hypothetical protein
MLVEMPFGGHRSLLTQALHSDAQFVCGFQKGKGGQAPEKSEMEPGPLPVGSGGHDEGVVENNNSANT